MQQAKLYIEAFQAMSKTASQMLGTFRLFLRGVVLDRACSVVTSAANLSSSTYEKLVIPAKSSVDALDQVPILDLVQVVYQEAQPTPL